MKTHKIAIFVTSVCLVSMGCSPTSSSTQERPACVDQAKRDRLHDRYSDRATAQRATAVADLYRGDFPDVAAAWDRLAAAVANASFYARNEKYLDAVGRALAVDALVELSYAGPEAQSMASKVPNC